MCPKSLHFYSIAIENYVYCRTKIISGFKKKKFCREIATFKHNVTFLGLQGSFLALSNESSPPYIRKALRWHDWHGIDITRDWFIKEKCAQNHHRMIFFLQVLYHCHHRNTRFILRSKILWITDRWHFQYKTGRRTASLIKFYVDLKSLSLSLLDRLIVRGLSVDPQLRHHPNVINFNLGNPNPLINCKKLSKV